MHTMYSLLGNQWDTGPAARRQDRLSGATANGRDSADPMGGNLLSGKPSNKEMGLSERNFQAKLENNLKHHCSSIQAGVPQASHLPKTSHLPHLQSLQEFCLWSSWHYSQLLRSWCGCGSLEYRQDGGSDSRVLDGWSEALHFLTSSQMIPVLLVWTRRAWRREWAELGGQLSPDHRVFTAWSFPRPVSLNVLFPLPTIPPFCLENSCLLLTFWLGPCLTPKIFSDPLLPQVDLGEMILSYTSILNSFVTIVYLSLKGLGILWKLDWVCLCSISKPDRALPATRHHRAWELLRDLWKHLIPKTKWLDPRPKGKTLQ